MTVSKVTLFAGFARIAVRTLAEKFLQFMDFVTRASIPTWVTVALHFCHSNIQCVYGKFHWKCTELQQTRWQRQEI